METERAIMVQLSIQKTIDGVPSGAPFSAEVMMVYGDGFFDARSNQVSLRTLDGVIHTFDTGVTVTYGDLTIKALSPSVKIALETYIRDTLLFNTYQFTIGIGGADVDLGLGVGVDVTGCNFADQFNTLSGMFQHRAPGIYHAKIPYTFVRG